MKRIGRGILLFALFSITLAGCGEDPKVMLIGVDGADWVVLNDLMQQGRLPNFQKIVEGGTRAELETIDPMLSPIIWTTIATAKDQEKHGITWFMVSDPKTGQGIPITSLNREVRAFWNMAGEQGRSVGVVGWWASWPAEEVNGFIVTDHMAYHGFGLGTTLKQDKGEPGRTYPEELAERLGPLVPQPLTLPKSDIDSFMKITQNEYDVSVGKPFQFENPLHHFMFMLATLRGYEAIGKTLYDEYRPDLFAIYFEGIDTTSHLYMKYRAPRLPGISPNLFDKYSETVNRVYEEQDRVLGEFIKRMDEDTTLIICSDHGFKTGEDRLTEVMNTAVAKAHLWHRKLGVLLMYGKKVKAGHTLTQARVADVGATALYLLGLPVASDMDGRVLFDALDPAYLADHSASLIQTYETSPIKRPQITDSSGMAEEMKQKLQSLGYLSGGESGPPAPAFENAGMDEKIKSLGYGPSFSSVEVRLNRVDAYLSKGEIDKALAEVRETVQAAPNDHRPFVTQANILMAMKKWEEALQSQKRALEIYGQGLSRLPRNLPEDQYPPKFTNPKAAQMDMLVKLGRCEMELGRLDKAGDAFEKAGQANPDAAAPAYNQALILEKKGDIAGAAKIYQANIARFPNHPLSHNNLGNCLMRLGKPGEAREHYEKTAALDPSHVESRHNLGVLYSQEGKIDLAMDSYEQALRVQPNFVPSRIALVELLVKGKKFENAREQLELAKRLDPKNPVVWLLHIRIEMGREKVESALQYLEVLEAMDPRMAAAVVMEYADLKNRLAGK